MTPDEADQLAKRIINTWHGGPPLAEWRDTLTELDAGTAGTTYVRLRAELDHAPSIARYLSEYRTLHTPANDPIRHHCHHCHGTGWLTCVDDRRHGYWCRHRGTPPETEGDCGCHAVTPCPSCPAGTHAEALTPRLERSNAA